MASKDHLGRLMVGAAIGVGPDRKPRTEALLRSGADVLVIDTAHGHSQDVIEAVKDTKKKFPECNLIAGNIATREATESLIKAGVDAVKVGMGPVYLNPNVVPFCLLDQPFVIERSIDELAHLQMIGDLKYQEHSIRRRN